MSVPQRKGDPVLVKLDEGPAKGDPSKFGGLKPAFTKDGTITAANASSINDGASALILASEAAVKKHNLPTLGRIVGYGSAAQAPELFTTAPAKAMGATMKKLGLTANDIDLFEINEAFAAVPMRFMRDLGVSHDRVNVNGGAIAMGHPLGATGAMILGTLIDELERRDLQTGLASLCVGGGMGIATIIERI